MIPYAAPCWLPGGQLQTLYAAKLVPLPEIPYVRERLTTPDGDFLDVDWVQGRGDNPLVILFHGLEGSSQSHYARAMMSEVLKRKWQGAVVNFRGCSGEANRLQRAYHSGDSEEMEWIMRKMQERQAREIFAVGFSLGGNVLLHWLGKTPAPGICAAAAVSVPYDLAACGKSLSAGFNRLYTRIFLHTLKKKVLAKDIPGLDRAKLKATKTLGEFDDLYTAPAHGFENVADYWEKASSLPFLANINVPTLLINAKNDPFLPAKRLPTAQQVSRSVTLEYPEEGGHAGFVSGVFPGALSWLPERILGFFAPFQGKDAFS